MKCANFNKIQPSAPDKGAHPKASSLLVILFEPSCLKYDAFNYKLLSKKSQKFRSLSLI